MEYGAFCRGDSFLMRPRLPQTKAFKRRTAAAAIISAFLLLPALAYSQTQPAKISAGRIEVQSAPTGVEITREGRPVPPMQGQGKVMYEMLVDDIVTLQKGAAVCVFPANAPPDPNCRRQAGPTEFIAYPPPVLPSGLATFRAYSQFWSLNKPPPLPVKERAEHVLRGSAGKGPLRWLPLVPAGEQVLPVGTRGIAIAWAGGTPPFQIALEGERSGLTRAVPGTDRRIAWDPQFAMADEAINVTVLDSAGNSLFDRIAATKAAAPIVAAPGEPPAAPADAAMALFGGGGPAWRLEALRRLAVLLPADQKAAEGIRALLGAGDAPP